MDKWDEMANRVTRAVTAEAPEAVLMGALSFFAELGRTLELISNDLDRLATATEKLTSE